MTLPVYLHLFTLLLAVIVWPSSGHWNEDAAATAALAADEQCSAQSRDDCALAALQLRGEKVEAASTADTTWASCQSYGCGAPYQRYRSCQCNEGCAHYGNCCGDYSSVCSAPPHPSVDQSSHHAGHIYGHPSASKAYPSYNGFTLMLVEEFDTPMDLDSDPIWTWSDGGLLEGQIRFVKEAIKFEDGKMKIEVSNSLHVATQSCSHAETGSIPHKPMTSGELRTKHNMFRYGRYEASIKAPSVKPGNTWVNGNYIATMFVFRDAKYKHWREIDFEITGGSAHAVTTNVLSADNTDKWSENMAESREYHLGSNTRAGFHTYAIEWLPDRISWYVDGQLLREKRGGHVPISDKSAKIMMNLWMFDHRALFGGREIWNNQYPMHSEYDWFRFYKWDGDAQYPCPGFGTSCLTADDQYLSSNNPCDGIPQVGTVYGKAPCHATCR